MEILLCLCVMLFTARVVGSSDYKKVGDTLTLTPDISSFPGIKSILWRHGINKVAEWDLVVDDSSEILEYYGNFQGRTKLYKQTGHLVIDNLQTSDTGVYSLELNSKPQDYKYELAVIVDVPYPKITETCNTPKTSCTLLCEGDTTGAEPVTYSWIGDEKALNVTDKKLTVITANQIKYTCQMKNPVSQIKNSQPLKNPLYSDTRSGTEGAPVLHPLIAVCLPIVMLVWS